MKGIILAAGEGKRLRPLTNNVPKCGTVQGKQIIDYVLEAFRDAGINDIYLVRDIVSSKKTDKGIFK